MARRRAAVLSLALALVAWRSSAALGVPGPDEARGDAAWTERALGFAATGRIAPRPPAEAVAAYERAWISQGASARLAGKLVAALWFRGHFVLADGPEARPLFDRAVEVAEAAVAASGKTGGREEAQAHFWAAIAWGVWGMDHGYLASGLRGVAGRIRAHAERAVLLDESFADAGPLRLLGRLHTVTPRLPLFTGWIDPAEGIRRLERAVAISTADPRNELFLAEALLRHAPQRRLEARELLARVAARTPAPAEAVEQSETIAAAKRQLAELQENPTSR